MTDDLPTAGRRAMRLGHVLTWCRDWATGRDGLVALLADARHWCDRHGESYADLDRVAQDHYLHELLQPKGDRS